MSNGYLIAFLNQISDAFSSMFNCNFLFWKCGTKCTMSQCNNNSFFHVIYFLSCQTFLSKLLF